MLAKKTPEEWTNMETRTMHTWLADTEYVDGYIRELIEEARKRGEDMNPIAKKIGGFVKEWMMPGPWYNSRLLNYESLCQGIADFIQKVDFRQIVEAYMEKGE